MKKMLAFLLLVIVGSTSFSQTPVKDKEYYLQKSKSQRSAANILLIGGTTAVGIGFLIGDRKESSFDDAATGVIIGGIGIVSMISSIPLYLAAGRNKRKAVSLALHNEKYMEIQKGSLVYRYIPSLAVRINL